MSITHCTNLVQNVLSVLSGSAFPTHFNANNSLLISLQISLLFWVTRELSNDEDDPEDNAK